MLLLATAIAFTLFIPSDAYAWGAGIHIQLGVKVLENLQMIEPAIAAIIGAHPNDFLYGCIAADITVGKKFTHYLLNCHRWRMGLKVLEKAGPAPQKACAYGYLAHLAADTIAHNYFVPFKIMRSFATLTMKHAYWEMRFERFVEQETWERARQVANDNYQANDKLLRKVIADTLFSFGTNKRIFNSILLVSRLEKWQQVLRTLSDNSRFVLEESDRLEYMDLTEQAVFEVLGNLERSTFLKTDPTGAHALAAADAVRKNLRILYRSGKIQKKDAIGQVELMKDQLREGILNPEKLQTLFLASQR